MGSTRDMLKASEETIAIARLNYLLVAPTMMRHNVLCKVAFQRLLRAWMGSLSYPRGKESPLSSRWRKRNGDETLA